VFFLLLENLGGGGGGGGLNPPPSVSHWFCRTIPSRGDQNAGSCVDVV